MLLLDDVPLAAADLAELAQALARAGLPADDIAEPGRLFLRFDDAEGRAVGFGGLESCGRDVMLRSIVVLPEARGRGFGAAIVRRLLQQAEAAGAERTYLLTTSAQGFFEAQGFVVVARDEVPPDILATRQAAGLCPASAVIMTKELAR